MVHALAFHFHMIHLSQAKPPNAPLSSLVTWGMAIKPPHEIDRSRGEEGSLRNSLSLFFSPANLSLSLPLFLLVPFTHTFAPSVPRLCFKPPAHTTKKLTTTHRSPNYSPTKGRKLYV